jgi:hypothetical protein
MMALADVLRRPGRPQLAVARRSECELTERFGFDYLAAHAIVELTAFYPPHREKVSSKGMNMSAKKERRKQNKATGDLREEVEMLDVMLSSLVDVLDLRESISDLVL